jgi:excisionase family DNA binding protein
MPRPRRRPEETSALFVRIPSAEAQKLDRVAYSLGAAKRDLIATLVARYVDPDNPEVFDELIESEPPAPELPLGKHWFRAADAPEVLTLAQLADLLQIDEDTARELAEKGELPGRRLGDEWRFSRQAVVDWLAEAEPPKKTKKK